ncbi:PASTA domain-containing protein [bacterium]|nr:PASTA domain-containing protein [bacterium]
MKTLLYIFAWIWRGIVFFAIMLGIILFVQMVVMPVYTRHWQRAEVPDLRGQHIDNVDKALRKHHFKLVVDDKRFTADQLEGIIMEQFPEAGAITKKGRRIHLVVSAGPPFVKVPDLVGMPREDALFAAQQSGLKLGELQYAFNDTVYEGQVVFQTPESGIEVLKTSQLDILFSLGKKPNRFVIPKVVGLPEDQAKYLVLKAGFKVGVVSYEKFVRRPEGTVIVQTPEPETPSKENAKVDLVVNREVETDEE